MSDSIRPAHYNQGSIECIEAMKIVLTPEEFRGYLKGNVFKYLWREKDKNGIEDLHKGKSYFDRLIDLVDESEQQKTAELQSLKDHPLGKPEQPAWTPKIGDWVRIKKPSDTHSTAIVWFELMDQYDGKVFQVAEIEDGAIVHEHLGFLFDWLEPAEQPKARAISDKIPQGYRKLKDSSEEPRQLGDLRWSISQKRYVEIGEEEIGYANRDNWAAYRKIEEPPKRYREPTQADLKNGPVCCEVRNWDSEQWKARQLIQIHEFGPVRFRCKNETCDNPLNWNQCRIEVTE